ncbi:hypothetical protein ACH429_20860 [Streptomyces pathocidini]|uniref:CMP/dCMP-type deaminase domain-containing protein n=1 Tax=Streptomyces pathocidini TaxID=1650571 RepID=A0ABW7UVP7_9ACTN|nr:hypothetical protein [Streptomyces pathocidini]
MFNNGRTMHSARTRLLSKRAVRTKTETVDMTAGWLRLALKQAARSPCRYRVGAVLAKGRRVLAQSSNRYRNHPGVDFRNATFHAEEMILRRARIPKGAIVYVARVNNAGVPMLARPCSRCQRALTSGGAKRVFYTTAAGPRLLVLG